MAKKGMGLLIAALPKKEKPESSGGDPFEPEDDDEEDSIGSLGGEDDDEGEEMAPAMDAKLEAAYARLCDASDDRDYGEMDRAMSDIIDRKLADR